MSRELIAYAQAYSQVGLSVLPAINKKGARKWPAGAPRMTEQEIENWWSRHPDHQVAIITGSESGGVVIIDVDDDAGVAELERRGFPLLSTRWRTSTGRGYHFGFRAPAGKHILGKVYIFGVDAPHVDIRGERNIAVMPPSMHKSGRQYEWLIEDDEFDLASVVDSLPELPISWFDKNGIQIVKNQRDLEFSADLDWDTAHNGGDLRNAKRWIAVQPPAIEGRKGENHTFHTCAKLVRDYGLTLREAWPLLQAWNTTCVPPWEHNMLRRKLEEAWQHGRNDRPQDDVIRRVMLARGMEMPCEDGEYVEEEDLSTEGSATTPVVSTPAPVAPTYVPDNSKPVAPPTTSNAMSLLNKLASSRAAAASSEGQRQNSDSADSDEQDEQYMREVSAAAASDPGYVFRADVLTKCTRIEQEKPHVFFRFESELRRVINHMEWKRARAKEAKKQNTKKIPQIGSTNAERPEIRINGDEMEIRDSLLKILEVEDGVYLYGGNLSYLAINKQTNNEQMIDLEGGKLRNLLCNVCKPVQPREADGVTIYQPTPLPANILQVLENLLPEQQERFRHVTRLVKAPFFLPDGQMITEPGHEPTTGTLLVECPPIDLDRFPTTTSAVNYLRDLLSTFPFETEADFANYIGALLTVMCRNMWHGATPWLLIQANMPSSGKSLLGELVQILYGYTPVKSKLPIKEEELEKTLLSLLVQAKPIIMFDNVKHVIESAALELLGTTGDTYEARVLGATATRKCPVRQLFLLTSNNATMSMDSARRFLSVRLLKREEIKIGQANKFPPIRAIVQENRAEILSALCRLVHDWVHRESKEMDSRVPSIASYEEFSHVIGGICYHAGLTDWASNFEKAMRDFAMHEELAPFLFSWWERFKDKHVGTTDLVNLAIAERMLGAWLGKSTDLNDRTAAFRKRLAEKRDLAYSGFVIKHTVDQKTQQLKFYLERVEDAPVTLN